MMLKVLLVAFGGALGALARAGVAYAVQRALGVRFPWGTVTVNLAGCFLFGLVFAWTEGRVRYPVELRLLLLTGFMGAFTTFSTFAFDTVQLGEASRVGALLANIALQNGVGVVALLLGLALGRSF